MPFHPCFLSKGNMNSQVLSFLLIWASLTREDLSTGGISLTGTLWVYLKWVHRLAVWWWVPGVRQTSYLQPGKLHCHHRVWSWLISGPDSSKSCCGVSSKTWAFRFLPDSLPGGRDKQKPSPFLLPGGRVDLHVLSWVTTDWLQTLPGGRLFPETLCFWTDLNCWLSFELEGRDKTEAAFLLQGFTLFWTLSGKLRMPELDLFSEEGRLSCFLFPPPR